MRSAEHYPEQYEKYLEDARDALRNLIAASGDYENEYGHPIEIERWWEAQAVLNAIACTLG